MRYGWKVTDTVTQDTVGCHSSVNGTSINDMLIQCSLMMACVSEFIADICVQLKHRDQQ